MEEFFQPQRKKRHHHHHHKVSNNNKFRPDDVFLPPELQTAGAALNTLGLTNKNMMITKREEMLARLVYEFNMGFGVYHKLRNPLYSGEGSLHDGNVHKIVDSIKMFFKAFKRSLPCLMSHTRRYLRRMRLLRKALLKFVLHRRYLFDTMYQAWQTQEVVLRERAKQRLHLVRQRNPQLAAQAQEEYLLYFMHHDLKMATIKRMYLKRRLAFAKKFDGWKKVFLEKMAVYNNRRQIAKDRSLLTTSAAVLDHERTDVLRILMEVDAVKRAEPHFRFDVHSVKIEDLVKLALIVQDTVTEQDDDELLRWERERYFQHTHHTKAFRIGKPHVEILTPRSQDSDVSDVIVEPNNGEGEENSTFISLENSANQYGPSPIAQKIQQQQLKPLSPSKLGQKAQKKEGDPIVEHTGIVEILTPSTASKFRSSNVQLHATKILCGTKDWRHDRKLRIPVHPNLSETWSEEELHQRFLSRPPAPLRAPRKNQNEATHVSLMDFGMVTQKWNEMGADEEEAPELDIVLQASTPGIITPPPPSNVARLRIRSANGLLSSTKTPSSALLVVSPNQMEQQNNNNNNNTPKKETDNNTAQNNNTTTTTTVTRTTPPPKDTRGEKLQRLFQSPLGSIKRTAHPTPTTTRNVVTPSVLPTGLQNAVRAVEDFKHKKRAHTSFGSSMGNTGVSFRLPTPSHLQLETKDRIRRALRDLNL
eukprot:PhF_6_TR40385/c0_g1_i1/m.60155